MSAVLTPERARMRDVPQMVAILRKASRARPVWVDARVLARVTARGLVRVTRDRHGVTGFSVRHDAVLHALYVHPRVRGTGVGRALLAEAKQAAGRIDLWVVQHNREARRFYARAGFAEKTRAKGGGNDENLPDILMVWPPERRAET